MRRQATTDDGYVDLGFVISVDVLDDLYDQYETDEESARRWEQHNYDLAQIEKDIYEWLQRNISGVTFREEGHGPYGDLSGSCWFEPSQVDKQTIESMLATDLDRSGEPWDTRSGTFPMDDPFAGAEEALANRYIAQVYFFGLSAEDEAYLEELGIDVY